MNQKEYYRDYIIINYELNETDELNFTIQEDQEYLDYIDKVQLIAVGHSENSQIGITKSGQIVCYNPKQTIQLMD